MRAANGLTWVVLLNLRPKDSDSLGTQLDQAMWQAFNGVKKWPDHDLLSLRLPSRLERTHRADDSFIEPLFYY